MRDANRGEALERVLATHAGAALIEFREEGPGRMLPMLAMAALTTGAAAAAHNVCPR
jgi:hypothetical protein